MQIGSATGSFQRPAGVLALHQARTPVFSGNEKQQASSPTGKRFSLTGIFRGWLDRFAEKPPTHPPIERPTTLIHETDMKYGAPHHFQVIDNTTGDVISEVHFQEGPVKEVGRNGVQNEDVLAMVIERLEGLQQTPYAGPETAKALAKIKEGLAWLDARTANRQQRGVEGRNKI